MAIKFTQITDHTNQRIINVASPTLDTDAANKIYVDNIAQGLTWKAAARVATTGNIPNLSAPGATIDGITLANGDRVLLKNQTTGSQNGIYVWNGASTALTRATDADASNEVVAGMALSVAEGTVNGDKTYVLITDNPIALGTTALTFSLMNGGSGVTYTAGNGIDTTGNAISVKLPASSGLVVSGSGLAIDTTAVVRKWSSTITANNPFTATHNLATTDVTIEVYEAASGTTVWAETTRTDTNTVSIAFASTPVNGFYKVVIHG